VFIDDSMLITGGTSRDEQVSGVYQTIAPSIKKQH